MINRSTDFQVALRSRQRGFLLNPFRYGNGPAADPYWSNVGLLMHFNGANNSTTFVDQKGAAFTRFGAAVISTAQSKFGGSSGYFPTSASAIVTANSPGIQLSTGDFTIECWILFPSVPAGNNFFINKGVGAGYFTYRLSTVSGGKITASCGDTGTGFPVNMTGATTIVAGVFYHIAFTRQGSAFRLFVNGVLDASATYAGNLRNAGESLAIGGASNNAGYSLLGYMDELRITAGVARYVSNFTPPASAFPDS